jgi:hypothetical protein
MNETPISGHAHNVEAILTLIDDGYLAPRIGRCDDETPFASRSNKRSRRPEYD